MSWMLSILKVKENSAIAITLVVSVSVIIWVLPFSYNLWYKHEILNVVRAGSPELNRRVARLEQSYYETVVVLQEDRLIISIYQQTLFEIVEDLALGAITPEELSTLTRSVIYNFCNSTSVDPPILTNDTIKYRYLGCVEVIKYEDSL